MTGMESISHKDDAMSYLEIFQTQINNRDFSKFMQLWEEYCGSDTVEAEEFIQLLQAVKQSDFAKLFGQLVETALPLWRTIPQDQGSYDVLKHLIDLQTTHTSSLAEIILEAIKQRHGDHPLHNERLRLVGLRTRENFQGALSNYDLLAHIEIGNFVYHTGGWGTGEIIEVSQVREQLAVEFENVAGKKHITFANAFKTLIPLSKDDFRSRRFADPDKLEKEAKKDPVTVIKMLLRDLGPKTASEIKDELCELVIPEPEWSKWWQGARLKLKKDPLLETPEALKGVFKLRKTELSQEHRLQKAMHNKSDPADVILSAYNFVRDLPLNLKKHDVKTPLKDQLLKLLEGNELSPSQEIEVILLLDMHFGHQLDKKKPQDLIIGLKDVKGVIEAIQIIALKKRALTLIRECRKDWVELFLSLLLAIDQSTLRDYILKELNQGEAKPHLLKLLKDLIRHPGTNPELFVWYFQKLSAQEDLPFADREGLWQFFEAFFILYSILENKPEQRDLVKKMYNIISGNRYATVRSIIEGTSLDYIKEFLLLVSKCQTLSDHDVKILRSLVEVVHPTLAAMKPRKGHHNDTNIIWTTEAGYLKTQERARHIGTIEVIENAREVEAARALGDLRENSEYKFALEKRTRLQAELKALSDQLNRARLITPDDISSTEVGIGSTVDLKDESGQIVTYTILGPWEADPDAHILSLQSKFAQALIGLKVGEVLEFRDEKFTVAALRSYLDR